MAYGPKAKKIAESESGEQLNRIDNESCSTRTKAEYKHIKNKVQAISGTVQG
jgi:hypothetical protein